MSVVDIIPVLQALGTQDATPAAQQQRVQAEEHLKNMEGQNFVSHTSSFLSLLSFLSSSHPLHSWMSSATRNLHSLRASLQASRHPPSLSLSPRQSGLVASLVTALNANDAIASQMAGLYLKNALTGQSSAIAQKKMERWVAVDPATRVGVKQGVGQALASQDKNVATAAAQIIAKIGLIEVPRGEWNDLIDTLITMSNSQETSKLAALQALGYLCEELDESVVTPEQTNNILTAIVNGISTGQNDEIKFAAIKALRDSLKFAEENFGRDQERDMILQQVLGATQYKPPNVQGLDVSLEIRKTAFECCAIICDRYYSQLTTYIESMWRNSVQAIQNDDEQIGLQALEVWTTIAEVEYEMMEEYDEQNACLNLIKTIHQQLVQLLLQVPHTTTTHRYMG
jgi:importin subunit beta-1